jgi:putative hydrolase of the HAD superfamily
MLKDKPILLCDIDGVLIHGQDQQRWDTALREDLKIEPLALQEKFFAVYWADVIRGRRHLKECLEKALPQINPNVSAEKLITYWLKKDSSIDHRVLDILKKYKKNGYTLHMATDQEHVRKEYLCNVLGLGLDELFRDVFYAADLGFTKKEDGFWELLKNKLNSHTADQMFFIDDQEENVNMAKKHGIDGYVYTHFEQALKDIF